MCVITKDGVYDLGTEKPGRVITFADGFAYITIDGETLKIPTKDIEQIISFE